MGALESMTENLSGALAKVGVEGSNPFARSNYSITYRICICFPAAWRDVGEAWGKQARVYFGAMSAIIHLGGRLGCQAD